MTLTSLGRVNVVTPGTPVRLTSNSSIKASKIYFQVIPGLTGKGYIGGSTMNKTTLGGVARVLWPNASGGISDEFFLETQDGTDSLVLSEYYIDLDIAGEGLLVTYWVE